MGPGSLASVLYTCDRSIMAELKSVSIVPLNGVNYLTWKVHCRMAVNVKLNLHCILLGSQKIQLLYGRNCLTSFKIRFGPINYNFNANSTRALTTELLAQAIAGDCVVHSLASLPDPFDMLVTGAKGKRRRRWAH